MSTMPEDKETRKTVKKATSRIFGVAEFGSAIFISIGLAILFRPILVMLDNGDAHEPIATEGAIVLGGIFLFFVAFALRFYVFPPLIFVYRRCAPRAIFWEHARTTARQALPFGALWSLPIAVFAFDGPTWIVIIQILIFLGIHHWISPHSEARIKALAAAFAPRIQRLT